jgi:hypothetical protein
MWQHHLHFEFVKFQQLGKCFLINYLHGNDWNCKQKCIPLMQIEGWLKIKITARISYGVFDANGRN